MAYSTYCLVCGGSTCGSRQSDLIYRKLTEGVERESLAEQVQVVRTGCFGFCRQGPNVKILPDEVFYVGVRPADVDEIVTEQLLKGRAVARLHYRDPASTVLANPEQQSFYQKQLRVVLRNCGFIDPENVEDYIARSGYAGLAKALFEFTPEEVMRELEVSGLRGRGGGGFPTYRKWQFSRNADSKQKYIVCNADEGDPGAYMDRSILEGDPHSVLEAMAIAGFTIGADKGFIYIRAEYPLAIQRLQQAIGEATERGLLGERILGSDFNFSIEVRLGAGAFVCGEETALLMSVEGKRGMPNQRPPYPAVKGLWGKPTVINNVETLANIPMILTRGGKWFASIGSGKSTGTKVFALTGKIKNTGLIEVPMGITFREIIFDIGGGIPDGKEFKAVQTGGPSGGMITREFLDYPVTYETLVELGSMMGSGGMIVMDEDDSMVNVANFYLGFTMDESCGKCVPCRVGGRRLKHLVQKFADGDGTENDLEKIAEIGAWMKTSSLCGLGNTAPNPVLSSIRHFRNEYVKETR